jgi:hypothetical protein
VIFDHLNGRYGRTEFLEQLIDQGHDFVCCPVNLTAAIARQAGLLRRDWQKKGQTFSYTDVPCPIAAPTSA